jgi:hypothetical protein
VGYFPLDPHADPHGETSGWKQWKQEGQRALISEQKVLKTSKNHYFYRFSTLRNQQVAGSSPATSSTKPVKIERFSPVFSFICSVFQAPKPPDPHRDPHAEMFRERRRGYAWYPLRRSVFFAACSHHLCHEITHLFGGAFLHLARDVGVGAEREARIEMAEHTRYSFHIHAILQCQRCECMSQVVKS